VVHCRPAMSASSVTGSFDHIVDSDSMMLFDWNDIKDEIKPKYLVDIDDNE
jgi:hypothetical protein